MGERQKEKSEMTRHELSDAMIAAFLEKGYDETSIKDIADRAGYSVGSFYRHWKSKQSAFIEYWVEFASEFTRESIENAPKNGSIEEMIDYLIMRSEAFSMSEINRKLYTANQALSANYAFEGLEVWAEKYTEMLHNFVKQATACHDERRLKSVVNIIFALLNAHATRHTNIVSPKYDIDNDTLRLCLLAQLQALKS